MMLVMLAVAATIFLAFHRSSGGGHPWWRNPHESALQMLNERFARGEIDQTEYEERRRLLQA
jgi:putative membrane protein